MNDDLTGKTIIITGANSGIGKAAAVQLAKLGANVVMACRSAERGMRAMEEVCREANSDRVIHDRVIHDRVEMMQVDMASQASIRRFAGEFCARHPRLDVLIHNAANFDQTLKQPTRTEDGVETIFATNHVGPFLLTHLLLDRLKASAPSRIITVASKGLLAHPFLDIEFDNLYGEKKFSTEHAYYHSKLAQVMFTYDLAERLRGTGVTVNCVRVTAVALPDERISHLPRLLQSMYKMKRKMSIAPERQAETYVYLAADPRVETVTGGYWDENNKQVKSGRSSYNKDTWVKLWEVTAKMAGV